MLKKDSIHPLYKQLMEELTGQIHRGVYKNGSQIPTEPELAKMYDVSRITVRRTIEEMCKKGYLVKRQGKGTFVKPQKTFQKITQSIDQSFSEACMSNNHTPSSTVLSCNSGKIDVAFANLLGMEDDQNAVCLEKCYCADDTPIMLVKIYVDPSQYPGFFQDNSQNVNFFPYMTDKYDTHFSNDRSFTLSCMNAPWEIAEKLSVSIGDPLLVIDRFGTDDCNHPVYCSRQYLVGNRYNIQFC